MRINARVEEIFFTIPMLYTIFSQTYYIFKFFIKHIFQTSYFEAEHFL